jgi:hypothetical protein
MAGTWLAGCMPPEGKNQAVSSHGDHRGRRVFASNFSVSSVNSVAKSLAAHQVTDFAVPLFERLELKLKCQSIATLTIAHVDQCGKKLFSLGQLITND